MAVPSVPNPDPDISPDISEAIAVTLNTVMCDPVTQLPINPPSEFFTALEPPPPMPDWPSANPANYEGAPPPGNSLEFDFVKRKMYLDELARCGRHIWAARKIGMHAGSILDHRKRDTLLAADCAEALSYWNDHVMGRVQHAGIDGAWEPVKGRINKLGQEGILYWQRKVDPTARNMEAKRTNEGYREQKTLDINQNVRVGVMVIRRGPKRTIEQWHSEESERLRLPMNPLEGIPGVTPEMLENMDKDREQQE